MAKTRAEYYQQNKEKSKEYYQKNKKKIIAQAIQWQHDNREKHLIIRGRWNSKQGMLQKARARAKKQNCPFDISIEDIVIPTHCPIFGIELNRSQGVADSNSPSLDKIIPSLGYVKGNIQVISHKANRLKSNASLEELYMLGKWAEGQIKPK